MLEPILFPLEVLGILSFALSGAIDARREKLDVVGVYFSAFATAFGGGTLRDLLIDRHPLFWIQHEWYLLLLLILTVAICLIEKLDLPRWLARASDLFEACGIGLFSVVGVGYGLTAGCGIGTSLLMGVITAIFGGVLRDMICNRIPYVFQRTELCATCALTGGILYVLLTRSFEVRTDLSLVAGAIVAAAMRWVAVWKRIHLPI